VLVHAGAIDRVLVALASNRRARTGGVKHDLTSLCDRKYSSTPECRRWWVPGSHRYDEHTPNSVISRRPIVSSESASIDFYGASWCGDCRRAQALLEHYGVGFTYHDVDASDDDKNKAIELSGRPNIPVLLFPDGSVLTEPSNPLLNEKLTELGMI
jgi:glutaredoxin